MIGGSTTIDGPRFLKNDCGSTTIYGPSADITQINLYSCPPPFPMTLSRIGTNQPIPEQTKPTLLIILPTEREIYNNHLEEARGQDYKSSLPKFNVFRFMSTRDVHGNVRERVAEGLPVLSGNDPTCLPIRLQRRLLERSCRMSLASSAEQTVFVDGICAGAEI
ncbi:hypothetical protein HNY73_019844 [Argiope bruennichi]|uniref:Uncharacterized protein n=1 Tax=Argiope bruennichi TaxID=94029 RepID=A0A8T0E4Q0_ARGBR|nr:hypothetical protein HNY73_019844 [Argiope bruennichi]